MPILAIVIELTSLSCSTGWRFERLVKPKLDIYYCRMNEKGESSDRVWYILRDISAHSLHRLGYLQETPSTGDVFLKGRTEKRVVLDLRDLFDLSSSWGWNAEVASEDSSDPSLRIYHL